MNVLSFGGVMKKPSDKKYLSLNLVFMLKRNGTHIEGVIRRKQRLLLIFEVQTRDISTRANKVIVIR